MYYVSDFSMTYPGGTGVEHAFHSGKGWLNSVHFSIDVELSNTATEEVLKFNNKGYDEDKFIKKINKYDPYGFGVSHYTQSFNTPESGITYYCVPVDMLSIKFLELVKSVEPIRNIHPAYGTEFYDWFVDESNRYNVDGFFPIDPEKSLYKFDTASNHRLIMLTTLCSLLDVMRLCPTWWYGDNYYIAVDRGKCPHMQGYKVIFEDAVKAKRFVAKAMTFTDFRHKGVVVRRY